MIISIDLNDSEIRVARGLDIVLKSPGYAVINNSNINLGIAAVHKSRLNPRLTHNRFWKNLNQDPIQNLPNGIRHNADLAYHHLLTIHEQIGKPNEVLFAIPGNYSNDQLSLLLGLADACQFKAVGLVDSAIAAAATVAGHGDYIHLDINLYQTILTHINVSDQVLRVSVEIIEGTGLSPIYDICAVQIADMFIKHSRFDPQHHAETEQALYNQIPGCLSALRTQSDFQLEIQYQNTQQRINVKCNDLIDPLKSHYRKILNSIPDGSVCLASDRVSALPGLIKQLPEAKALDPISVFKGCQEHVSRIRSSGPTLDFITSLPAPTKPVYMAIPSSTPVMESSESNNYPVTHILHDHRAYPLGSDRLYLSATGSTDKSKKNNSHCSVSNNHSRILVQPEGGLAVFVNGGQINSPVEAGPGDTIGFAGSKTEFIFINVANERSEN